MSDPIVVDCGGSTRIKRILANGGFGDMGSLMDVKDLTPPLIAGTGPLPAGSSGSQHQAAGPFTNMSIVFQDSAGVPFMVPVAPLPPSFLVMSNGGQNVRGDLLPRLGGGFDLILTVFSTSSDPLVEAKQDRMDHAKMGRRRYIVNNAGPIKTVYLNVSALPPVNPPVFDTSNVTGPPPVPPVAVGAIGPAGGATVPAAGSPLYVSVVLS
ncbi:MAG TPA: hypothetical protein VKB88_32380 [Bryobacteraceae bacterium]|nr:hypothetical protein [Bryobacteraceae bacterium]